MCGLVAILGAGQSLDDRLPVVARMLARIAHRGPDDEGIIHIDRQAIFGHRRLSVIDVEHGHQPMVSGDGRYTLVFNGEIYNYVELRRELQETGSRFRTNCDTEVLPELLIRDGATGLQRLNGMFAFVFHDRKTGQWLAARDPFGVKPLYHAAVPGEMVFASEIKALVAHPEIHAARDDGALQQYLTFQFCLDQRTLFRGIEQLKPGHYVAGRGERVERHECYWDASYEVDHDHTEEWFIERLRELLDDSARLQIRADVPLGAHLSGGLDSTAISALACRESGHPVSLFHGRFAEGDAYDESRYARLAAVELGATLYEVVPTAADFVALLPDLVYALDEPLGGPGVFPQYCVSRLAREQVKVVLGGQGGDEIFGGYARYLVGYLEQALKGAIFETQEEGRHLVTLESIVPQLPLLQRYGPLMSQFWAGGLFEDMDARYFRLIDRSGGQMTAFADDLRGAFDRVRLFGEFQQVFNHPDTRSYINKMTHFDSKTLLPALLQVEDRVSMAVSLESRVPLLDTRIIELVASMPPPVKFQGGRTKHVLKRALDGIVPESIRRRKDKMGFPVPLKEWMQGGPVREFVGDVLLSMRSRQRGVYTEIALESMLDHQGVGSRQLWGALSLELWHRTFIDAA